MSHFGGFADPFFEGVATPPPATYDAHDITLAGHPYVIEPTEYRRQFIDDLRESSDQSNEPTEAAFNTATTWRRGASSWHSGAGQRDFDLEVDVNRRSRFRSSLNVDVWTHQEARPLPALTMTDFGQVAGGPRRAVMSTNAGWYASLSDGFYLSSSLGMGHLAIQAVQVDTRQCVSVTQVGHRCYGIFDDGAGNFTLRRWVVGDTATVLVTPSPDFTSEPIGVAYAAGRLFVWCVHGHMWTVNSGGTAEEVYAHPWGVEGFEWGGVMDTPQGAFLYGSGPTQSEVYRVVTDDTGALGPPVFAGSLPVGETLNTMLYQQGSVVMGSSLGFHVGLLNDTLQYGPLVRIEGGVDHVVADGRYVLFSWSDYDPITFPEKPSAGTARYSGLGRIDLSTFTSPLVPAYAPDLMTRTGARVAGIGVDTEAGEVVVLFADGHQGRRNPRAFPTTPVFLKTGRIRYGAYDPKLFSTIDVMCEPLPAYGEIDVSVDYDGGGGNRVGTLEGFGLRSPNDPFPLSTLLQEWAEVTFTFKGPNPGLAKPAPVLIRWTMRALPNPRKAEEIVLPLRLWDRLKMDQGLEWDYDVQGEINFLRDLARTQAPVLYIDGDEVLTVYLNNVVQQASARSTTDKVWQGLVTLQLRTVI